MHDVNSKKELQLLRDRLDRARERILARSRHRTALSHCSRDSTHGFRSVHFLEASSKVPCTRGGTSSSSSSSVFPAAFLPKSPISFWRASYCWGPTCLMMSGSMSLSCFDSGFPVTIKRFSRTENWTKHKVSVKRVSEHSNHMKLKWNYERCELLTEWFAEMNDSVVILEHVDFINVGKWLNA